MFTLTTRTMKKKTKKANNQKYKKEKKKRKKSTLWCSSAATGWQCMKISYPCQSVLASQEQLHGEVEDNPSDPASLFPLKFKLVFSCETGTRPTQLTTVSRSLWFWTGLSASRWNKQSLWVLSSVGLPPKQLLAHHHLLQDVPVWKLTTGHCSLLQFVDLLHCRACLWRLLGLPVVTLHLQVWAAPPVR